MRTLRRGTRVRSDPADAPAPALALRSGSRLRGFTKPGRQGGKERIDCRVTKCRVLAAPKRHCRIDQAGVRPAGTSPSRTLQFRPEHVHSSEPPNRALRVGSRLHHIELLAETAWMWADLGWEEITSDDVSADACAAWGRLAVDS